MLQTSMAVLYSDTFLAKKWGGVSMWGQLPTAAKGFINPFLLILIPEFGKSS